MQSLACLLWAYARLGHRDDALLHRCAATLRFPGKSEALSPAQCAACLVALATFGLPDGGEGERLAGKLLLAARSAAGVAAKQEANAAGSADGGGGRLPGGGDAAPAAAARLGGQAGAAAASLRHSEQRAASKAPFRLVLDPTQATVAQRVSRPVAMSTLSRAAILRAERRAHAWHPEDAVALAWALTLALAADPPAGGAPTSTLPESAVPPIDAGGERKRGRASAITQPESSSAGDGGGGGGGGPAGSPEDDASSGSQQGARLRLLQALLAACGRAGPAAFSAEQLSALFDACNVAAGVADSLAVLQLLNLQPESQTIHGAAADQAAAAVPAAGSAAPAAALREAWQAEFEACAPLFDAAAAAWADSQRRADRAQAARVALSALASAGAEVFLPAEPRPGSTDTLVSHSGGAGGGAAAVGPLFAAAGDAAGASGSAAVGRLAASAAVLPCRYRGAPLCVFLCDADHFASNPPYAPMGFATALEAAAKRAGWGVLLVPRRKWDAICASQSDAKALMAGLLQEWAAEAAKGTKAAGRMGAKRRGRPPGVKTKVIKLSPAH